MGLGAGGSVTAVAINCVSALHVLKNTAAGATTPVVGDFAASACPQGLVPDCGVWCLQQECASAVGVAQINGQTHASAMKTHTRSLATDCRTPI